MLDKHEAFSFPHKQQMKKYRYISLTLVAAFAITGYAQEQILKSAPQLVVNISIDQLRSDYMEAFAPLYGTNGFKRLLKNGTIYTNASYPFSQIDRASAIASIATGTTPFYNSIVGARWLNKETLRPVYCVDDENHQGYYTKDCSSPKKLSTSTICDELKVATNGKAVVYSIAPFRDAAILSAGHAADGAIWIDDNDGTWCSSTYYFDAPPSWLQAFNSLHSLPRTIDISEWQPKNALSGNFSYFMTGGMQKPFKRKFTGARRFREYKTSGLVNESITDIAIQCINSNVMGSDAITDCINITYYAGNFDHRPLAECQMELQDTYVRLDSEIGRLIDHVEKRVGADNVLFVITSTGYCDEDNTDYTKFNIPSGTFNINRTANLLNMYFGAIWGQGKYVETCFGPQMFLNHKLFEQKQISFTDASKRAQEFLSQISGIRNVYTSLQLLSDNNPQIYKIRNGFHPERNGDIQIEVTPGWHLVNEDYMENQLYRASFIQFPIIIYGTGVKAERINTPVTIDRIAPTVTKAIRIRAPNACSSEPLF